MFGSKNTDPVDELLAQLTKRHRNLLKTGEVFLAGCHGFGAGEPHPVPKGSGLRRPPVAVTASEERLQMEALARFRLASVQDALGMQDSEFSELPPSDDGYVLSHTDRRMLIFDGSGKTYMLQAPMKGLWLQPVDHGDGLYTLVFSDGEERVAVSTLRESADMTKNFIESFPDRRQQTRVVSVTPKRSIVEF